MAEVTFTDDNFAKEIEGKVALVDFWAPWCGPCKMQGPIVDELAGEIGDEFVVGKLNVDENMKVATKFGVQSIPTLIVLKNGEEVDRMVGVQSKDTLKEKLEAHK